MINKKEIAIVVFCHHGLGDLIMAKNALDYLDSSVFEGRVFILVKSELEKSYIYLLEWRKKIDVIVLRANCGVCHYISVVMKLLRYRIDSIVFIHGSARRQKAHDIIINILRSKKASGVFVTEKKKYGVKRILDYTEQRCHKSNVYNMIMKSSGLKCEDLRELGIKNDEVSRKCKDKIDSIIKSKIVVAFGPGSGELESHKRWPVEYYCILAEFLLKKFSDKKIHIILIGSRSELPLLKKIYDFNKSFGSNITVMEGFQLFDVISVLEMCNVIVCGDSGVAHIASIVNIPIVMPCQPTNPFLTAPNTSKLWVIRNSFNCSPCYREGFERGCSDADCMSYISPVLVMQTVERVLEGEKNPKITEIKNKMSHTKDMSVEQC